LNAPYTRTPFTIPVAERDIRIRLGHCHILEHQDGGMMSVVRVE
jgi:FtsP/CotA-like multicopper oxidase with cupredoxin domain